MLIHCTSAASLVEGSAGGGIRTRTVLILSQLPLPIGPHRHKEIAARPDERQTDSHAFSNREPRVAVGRTGWVAVGRSSLQVDWKKKHAVSRAGKSISWDAALSTVSLIKKFEPRKNAKGHETWNSRGSPIPPAVRFCGFRVISRFKKQRFLSSAAPHGSGDGAARHSAAAPAPCYPHLPRGAAGRRNRRGRRH